MTETARIYGTALYELGVPESMIEEAATLFRENPILSQVLTCPVENRKKKHAIIVKVFRQPEFSKIMTRFLIKACDAGCIGQMKEIASRQRELSLLAESGMKACLYYVTPPEETQLIGIKAFLCRKFHKKRVDLQFVHQPNLIGGFILKAGDTEYDYSLRGQLDKLARTIAG